MTQQELLALYARIARNVCPFSGLSSEELLAHVEGIVRIVLEARAAVTVRSR